MNNFIEVPATKLSLAGRKLLYGKGNNDASYLVNSIVEGRRIRCPYYRKWDSMLTRCYSKNFHSKYPTYGDCFVCEEWLLFSNFKKWMKTQDWEDKHLDKDLISTGNKEYRPDTCMFIDKDVNTLMNNSGARRGKYPQGVTYVRKSGNFKARTHFKGKIISIGTFKSCKDAENAYLDRKFEIVRIIAKEYISKDVRVYKTLINIADNRIL